MIDGSSEDFPSLFGHLSTLKAIAKIKPFSTAVRKTLRLCLVIYLHKRLYVYKYFFIYDGAVLLFRMRTLTGRRNSRVAEGSLRRHFPQRAREQLQRDV